MDLVTHTARPIWFQSHAPHFVVEAKSYTTESLREQLMG